MIKVQSIKIFIGSFLTIFMCSCGSDNSITADLSGEKAINTFTISGIEATINESTKTISANMAVGTDITSLSPTITVSEGATINPVSGASQNFTETVTYTVTAEDASKSNYNVIITVDMNSEKMITDFTVSGIAGTIDQSSKTISANMPPGTDITSLSPIIELSLGATVNPASGVQQDFTNAVTYTVTAEDASTIDYNVMITVDLSSEKAINTFTISGVDATIDEVVKTVSVGMPVGTDISSLTPMITLSQGASVNPASEVQEDFTNPVTYTVTAEDASTIDYVATVTIVECTNADNIYTFTYNNVNYEVVREKKTWIDAASCAVERGGYLAEINDLEEQTAIFSELANASIDNSNTVAPDGGSASYIWLGGNDMATEGNWIWDGNNDNTGTQFWMGTQSGTPVNGLYNNWGNEPDDFGSAQDGLGLALTNWPLGSAGQWNDVNSNNSLYFLIEYN